MIKSISEFFAKNKVESMSLMEYKSYGSDVPVKDYIIRRYFGSWNRVLSVINKRYPVSIAVTPAPKQDKKVEKKDGK